jgi:hypothetical protein
MDSGTLDVCACAVHEKSRDAATRQQVIRFISGQSIAMVANDGDKQVQDAC